MTEPTYYKLGDHYRICDRTGFKIRNSKSKKQWDNLIVRTKSWEPRHPQDFVRGVVDHLAVYDARPRTEPKYIQIPVLLTDSGTGGAGPPLLTEEGSLIYVEGGPFNELPPVDPAKYPKSY